MSKEIVALSPEDKKLIVEIAQAMTPYENEIAGKWDDLFVKERKALKESDRAIRDFKEAVWLLLTSLADGDINAYFSRIEEKGAVFANTKERYENLILSFHLYEEASFPFIQSHFPEKTGQIRSTFDHLYHNVIAILARAYFKELERDRERFVSILAHDLKSPLTTIGGFATLLMEEDDNRKISKEKRLKFLSIIKESSDRIRQLIDNALSYGKLKSGRVPLKLREANLVSVIREAVGFLLSEAEKANLTLTINGQDIKEWDNIKPVNVVMERDMVLRALLNFISNAVKYSRSRISISIQEREDDVLISVEDDGLGIHEKHTDLIFEDYYMVPGSKPGTGLGLPSVRMIASMHNGRTWVESEPGKGSTFYLRLPIRQSSV